MCLEKTVSPALALFLGSTMIKGKSYSGFFQDLDWFLELLTHFNGTVSHKMPDPHADDTVDTH